MDKVRSDDKQVSRATQLQIDAICNKTKATMLHCELCCTDINTAEILVDCWHNILKSG